MDKKAQTEDVFADLIPSIILITIGVLVLFYFSYGYSKEIQQNEGLITMVTDRETFSIAGIMNHKINYEGKDYKFIELIEKYYTNPEKGKYEDLLSRSIENYLDQAEPKITTCFKIILEVQQKELEVFNRCELTYVMVENEKSEEAIIPLSDGNYGKIRIEYGEPQL